MFYNLSIYWSFQIIFLNLTNVDWINVKSTQRQEKSQDNFLRNEIFIFIFFVAIKLYLKEKKQLINKFWKKATIFWTISIFFRSIRVKNTFFSLLNHSVYSWVTFPIVLKLKSDFFYYWIFNLKKENMI